MLGSFEHDIISRVHSEGLLGVFSLVGRSGQMLRKRGTESGEKGQTLLIKEWEHTPEQRRVYNVLEEIRMEVGMAGRHSGRIFEPEGVVRSGIHTFTGNAG